MEKEVTAKAYNANLIGNAEIVENPYRTKKRPNNVYATVFERGRQAGIQGVVEFIKSYISNGGFIVEKYTSKPNYVAGEWQPFVGLLDTISRQAKLQIMSKKEVNND